jgi:acyl carrier protein
MSVTREELSQDLRRILHESFAIPESALTPEARLIDDLALDSIDIIDLSVRLEERTGFSPRGPQLRTLVTLQDVVEFLHRHQQERAVAVEVERPPAS